MLKINTILIKTPSKFQVTIADVYGENLTNAKGDNIIDRIGTKRNMSCEWASLTQIECSTLLTAMTNVYFDLEYPDPLLGIVTKNVFIGSRDMPIYSAINNVIKWEGLTVNFTER